MKQNAVQKGTPEGCIISIVTATYNRGYCLYHLYQSLQQQTSFHFEWIVVDDTLICLNDDEHCDDFEGLKKQLVHIFEQRYPQKSSFER